MVRWRKSLFVVVPLVMASWGGSPQATLASDVSADPALYAGVANQLAPYCQTPAPPAFEGRLAELKGAIGDVMGDAVECAHVDNVSGDVVQRTSTGLAYIRAASGVPTFTNGSRHWAIAPMGLVEWDGPEADPPGAIAPPPIPNVPAVPDVPTVPDVPPPGSNPQAPPVPNVPSIPGIPGIPSVPGVPGVPGVPSP